MGMMLTMVGDVQLRSCGLSRMRLSWRIYRDVWSIGDKG